MIFLFRREKFVSGIEHKLKSGKGKHKEKVEGKQFLVAQVLLNERNKIQGFQNMKKHSESSAHDKAHVCFLLIDSRCFSNLIFALK